jgi:hypothetical protein
MVFRRATNGLLIRPANLPQPIWTIIERHRYDAVRVISIVGSIVALVGGIVNFVQVGSVREFASRTLPQLSVFLMALGVARHDGGARRAGPFLCLSSAAAMLIERLFSAPEAAGHFLFFPAAALGTVLLLGFGLGLLVASGTLATLYLVYLINIYFHPFPVFISMDHPIAFVQAFVMTVVMIVLAGRMVNDVQSEYEASNVLLTEYLDEYRSLLSLLTGDLTTSVSKLRTANDPSDVKTAFKTIRGVIETARRVRSKSFPDLM